VFSVALKGMEQEQQELRGVRCFRRVNNLFFESINDLKRAHYKLFSPEPHAAISRRYLGSNGFGLVTCSVRVLGYKVSNINLRPFIRRGLAALIDQLDGDSPYEVLFSR